MSNGTEISSGIVAYKKSAMNYYYYFLFKLHPEGS